jgi:hypothetical protein
MGNWFDQSALSRIEANQSRINRNQKVIADNQIILNTKMTEITRLLGVIDGRTGRTEKVETKLMTQVDDLVAASNSLKAAADKEIASLAAIEAKLAASPVANDPAVAGVIAQLQATQKNLTDAGAAADEIVNPPAAGSGTTSG